jgi:hypothetical protein
MAPFMKRIRKTFKKYFVPHEANDHRPHIFRMQAVAFIIFGVLVLELVFLFGASHVIPRYRLFGIIVTNALIDGANAARAANHFPTLREDPALHAAAQAKANDMAKNNYFAHTSPSGIAPWYWFEKAGYRFTVAGENLAVNFSDSQDVTNAWLHSPSHRANILNGRFTEIGIATAEGVFEGHPAIYVVQFFGAPKVSSLKFLETASAVTTSSKVVASAKIFSAKTSVLKQNLIKGAESTPTPAAAGASQKNPIAPSIMVHEANLVQTAASEPRRLVDYIYLAIILIFVFAIFIGFSTKLHFRHPELIMGGMLVVLVVGLLIVFNQHAQIMIL